MAIKACWVILIGDVPTSFRSKTREELVPTFKQLQRTQPDVRLRWYERGKVWENPDAAAAAVLLAQTEARERRTKDWRPGGAHVDPRKKYEMSRDEKRAKFKGTAIRKRMTAEGDGGRPQGRSRPSDDPFSRK
jgi:hypothetical protein